MPTVLAGFVRLLAVMFAASALAEPKAWEGAVELPGGIKLNFSVKLEAESGTISIPMQGVKDLKLEGVSVKPDKITFMLKNPAGGEANAVFEYTPAADGKTAEGALKQMGQEFKSSMKALAAGEGPKGLNRPQEPKAPFPYAAVEVSIPVGADGKVAHTLAGTLTVPEGKGPFPAVVMVTGSGPQDRDESLLGHRPFLVIADHLTRNGIAVLRYDDRGTAKSGGAFATATTDDFVDDALAAVAFARTRPEVDPKRVGIVGHSEGGLVAPMAAARSDSVAFIVLLAGPGMPSVELLALQGKLIGLAGGTPADKAERSAKVSLEILGMIRDDKPESDIRAAIRKETELEAADEPELAKLTPEAREKKVAEMVDLQMEKIGNPWMKRFLHIDPATALSKVRVPMLAINGEKDLQVPPKENLAGIKAASEKAGIRDVTIRELPGLNHLFQTCKTGSPAEYAGIEETFAPAALDVLTHWIRVRADLEKPTDADKKPAAK